MKISLTPSIFFCRMLKQAVASIAHVHNPQTVYLVEENAFVLVEIMFANMFQMTPLQGEDIRLPHEASRDYD